MNIVFFFLLFLLARCSFCAWLTQKERNDIVKKMNDRRRKVGASNMPMVTWNSKIECKAYAKATKCINEFSPRAYRDYDTGVGIRSKGETTWVSSSGTDQTFAESIETNFMINIRGIHREERLINGDYDVSFVIHVLSNEILEIGCARVKCKPLKGVEVYLGDNEEVWWHVCQSTWRKGYDPAKKLFTKGEACSSCPYPWNECCNGLCARDKSCKETSGVSEYKCKEPGAPGYNSNVHEAPGSKEPTALTSNTQSGVSKLGQSLSFLPLFNCVASLVWLYG